jgi:hypothetical protein
MSELSELVGKTMKSVVDKGDEIEFITTDNRVFVLYHAQDCCESVYVEDVCGDLSDLVGSPLLQAEEISSNNDDGSERPALSGYDDSFTWTFYRIATVKGSATIRFYGSSNGYYSESVDFKEVTGVRV